MNDNIIQIDTLRIERHKPRKCTCEDRHFTIDTTNREVACDCGLVVDPFEALEHITKYYENINEKHKQLNEQAKIWMKQKPHSVLFKELEQRYQRGKMLPYCPSCDNLIELDKLSGWGNAEFYLKRQKEILASKKDGDKG